jgi:hypothetical protein
MKKNLEFRIQNLKGITYLPYKFHILNSAFCLLITFTCLSQKNKTYHEDLSKLRPRIEKPSEVFAKKDTVIEKKAVTVTPIKTVNARVDAVLDSLDLFNLMRKYVDGYTIQIYSGQKREDAMNTKKKMQEEVPNLIANLQYQQPKFRVTVGKYFSKLEAQKDLLTLRRNFSTAILVPEKILIK